MSVITNLPDAFTVQFESSFDAALQQMASELRGNVTVRQAGGERYRLNNRGLVEAQEINTRGGATVQQDLDVELVSIFPQAADVVLATDEFDPAHLGELALPSSDLVQDEAAAVNRFIDNEIVAAFTGVRYLGKTGTTAEAFPTATQQIAVTYGPATASGNLGLNFEKIANAAFRLDTDEVPQGNRFLGIRAKQMEDLYLDIIANHATDMSSIKMLEGQRAVSEICGFKIIQNQRFLVDGSDIATCVAWHKSQVVLAIWNDRKVYADILPTQRHALQVRTTINVGATRRRNEGVVSILCDQSPA